MDQQAFAQLLGNYGEFLGAVAVVVTLVYLSIQVRHGKEATEANTKSLNLQAYQSWQAANLQINIVDPMAHRRITYIEQGYWIRSCGTPKWTVRRPSCE